MPHPGLVGLCSALAWPPRFQGHMPCSLASIKEDGKPLGREPGFRFRFSSFCCCAVPSLSSPIPAHTVRFYQEWHQGWHGHSPFKAHAS